MTPDEIEARKMERVLLLKLRAECRRLHADALEEMETASGERLELLSARVAELRTECVRLNAELKRREVQR